MSEQPEDQEPTWEDRRLSFGARAEDYDAVRPSYVPEALEWALGGKAAGTRVIDVGAGTGKATRLLANAGATVLAVEPDPAMRAVLQATVPTAVTTLAGSAEDLPVDSASVDAVVVAQAFHWFDRERAVPELARVLRPRGRLGLVWNRMDTDTAWVAEFDAVTGHTPRVGDAGPPEDIGPLFTPEASRDWPLSLRLSRDGLVLLASTFSWVARNDRRDQILGNVAALADRVAADGVIEMPWRTGVWRYLLTDSSE